MSSTKVFHTWSNMRQRCFNKKTKGYKKYGAKGITVHPDWEVFDNFFKDMGHPPSDKHTIDRINSRGIYEAKNCRWALQKTQQNNRTNNRLITYKGETKTLMQWCNIFKREHKTVTNRIAMGWTNEEALEIDPYAKRKPLE